MIALRAEALLLNAALGVGIGLLVSWGTKKITEAAQRVQNVATKSKEAADAAQSTTSSLKDLVSAYEELGDKSGWGTEDFDQAKDIQAEILDLAKEQGTLDENKLGKLDLQNGKYEEQLGLLQDITAEQLEASRYELTQNKDAQGDKLVDTAKKNNRTHYLTVWSAPEMDMGDQIKNAGIDVFNKFGGYGPDDLNDADSVVDYYNKVGKALKYVIDNTTEAERAAGGTYHSLYQFLLDEQSALRDDVDSYNDSTDAVNENANARRKLQAVDFWQNDNNNSMDVSFTFDKVNSAVQTLEDTIDGFDASKLNELLWGTNEGLSDNQAQALTNLRKALTDMDFSADTNGVNAFIQALVQVGIVAQSSANGVDALAAGAQKMEDISSKMDEIQSAYKASTSAMEEYNQYGYMSLDSLQSLLTMNTEYLNCLELVNGNASIIQSIGDISGFYPGYVDFSHGVKLTDLKIGSAVEGYKNTNMTDFAVGNNTLLEHLNLQNVPNLKKSISLIGCTNLEEFYAGGSGITGVAFAKGGKIKKAELPAIASLSAKNLNYLTDLKITDYKNITTLTVENCPTIDLTDMLAKCTNLNRVRLTGIDWQLDDTSLLDRLLKMTGLDENGYNTDHSVVEGSVHVPIMRERQLAEFTAQWPDLNITYNTLVQQFKWTFVNKDGTVLDIQYIDKGGKAVDPVTREENPIPTPTAESTISTDFTFSGWDTEFTTVFSNQTITALYTESVRKYTVRYMNRGAVLQETVAPYGSMVLYTGDTPTYTSEETAFKYYFFSSWDKGGYVIGDKDINAVYDVCEYSSTYFDGKEIGQLRPVEIYAMNKVGVEQNIVEAKDEVSIKLGNDFTYDDITEKILISEPQVFDGKNYIDTDLKLFEEDRDFVLAVDYKMDATNANNTVLMQCFEQNGMNGIRLWNSTGVKMTWGIDSANGVSAGSRDMTVIRHVKGDNGLYVYSSNIYGSALSYTKINRTRITKTNATLVFGCAKADDGAYERHAKGTVYWSKLWYADLGDAACRELAAWTHDNLIVEVASFKNYYLSDNSNKRCSITFLQKRCS